MTPSAPVLSLVVATGIPGGDRNACLAAAAGQQVPAGDAEVIESTVNGDLGHAWNLGAARASGRTLLFLRDDVELSATAAGDHLARICERPSSLVVGPTELHPRTGGLSRYYAEYAGTESALAECAGRTLAIDRDLFRECGGFATELEWGAETELAYRLSSRGTSIERLPMPTAVRHVPRTLREIATLLEREGRGSVELYRRHPGLLPSLKLGAFAAAGEGALAMRRLLLAVGQPVMPLGAIDALVPAGDRRRAWYRFVCDYLYWRGVRRALDDSDLWARLARGPVILMYHAIGDTDEQPGCYIVPAQRFDRQMRWLKLAGYHVLGLDELSRYQRDHRLPPARSVVITFDDGYRDNWTLAVPALRRFGFTATFFLVTGRLGAVNDWDTDGELAGRPLLTPADARAMLDAGMTIGTHTRTHPVLPDLEPDAVADELRGARQDLSDALSVAPEVFAYPFGRLDASIRRAVEQAGYTGACCSRSGVNDPMVSPFLLRRLEVRGTDSLVRFMLGVRRGRARRRRRS